MKYILPAIAAIALVGCAAEEPSKPFSQVFQETCGYSIPVKGSTVYFKNDNTPLIVTKTWKWRTNPEVYIDAVHTRVGETISYDCVTITPTPEGITEITLPGEGDPKYATMEQVAKLSAKVTALELELGLLTEQVNDLENPTWRTE